MQNDGYQESLLNFTLEKVSEGLSEKSSLNELFKDLRAQLQVREFGSWFCSFKHVLSISEICYDHAKVLRLQFERNETTYEIEVSKLKTF